jgi:hypothetical protein
MSYPKQGEGFLYVLFRRDNNFNQHHSWFLKSFDSLKKHVPNAKVCLYTNEHIEERDLLDEYIYDENHRAINLSVADGLLKSPFEKTIYLDNDIVVERPLITGVFKFLKEYSFAGVYANWWGEGTLHPDFHGGLMGVNTGSELTRELIREWIDISEGDLHWSNQKTLRRLMRKHRKEFCILPSHLVFRWNHIYLLVNDAIVTHGHEMDKLKITKKIISSLQDSLLGLE